LFKSLLGFAVWSLIYNLNVKRVDVAAAIGLHSVAARTGGTTEDAEQGNIA